MTIQMEQFFGRIKSHKLFRAILIHFHLYRLLYFWINAINVKKIHMYVPIRHNCSWRKNRSPGKEP